MRPKQSGQPDQHFGGHCALTQTGVKIAGTQVPPGAQTFTEHVLSPQFVAHMPASLQLTEFDATWVFFFFFAASDGAAETAIAMTATVPTSRSFANDFMV